MAATKVTVFSNGPIRIEGDFEIVDQDGQKFGLGGRTAVTVCRCGHSAKFPVLRWYAQATELYESDQRSRPATPGPKGLKRGLSQDETVSG